MTKKLVSYPGEQFALHTQQTFKMYIYVYRHLCRRVWMGDINNNKKLDANQSSTLHNQKPYKVFITWPNEEPEKCTVVCLHDSQSTAVLKVI